MERVYIHKTKEYIGQEVTICGWVHVRRDHGKLIFIEIRDVTGIIQAVALPNHPEAHAIVDTLRSEWVIVAKGIINARPKRW